MTSVFKIRNNFTTLAIQMGRFLQAVYDYLVTDIENTIIFFFKIRFR